MTQGDLFPVRVMQHCKPLHGKDVKVDGYAEDGMRWTLKRQSEHPGLPAGEFLAYRLAQACSLPTPHFGILRDLDGAPVFGSRHEAGLVNLQELSPLDQARELSNCQGRICACFAIDLFLGNEDRHFGNFLFRRRADGLLTAMPIDWGRAWFVNGWPPRDVHLRKCITTNHIELLRSMNLWSPTDALMLMGTLASVSASRMAAWAEEMPAAWLSQVQRGTLAGWWGGEAFHARVSTIIEFCR